MTVVAPVPAAATAARRSAFTWRRTDLLISLSLVALVFALYWPVRHYGYVRYDDDTYIFDNPHAQQGLTPASAKWAVTHLLLANYMPLPLLSLLTDVSLWGMRPGPMHVENAVLHGLSTIGWYLAWVRLTGRRGRSFMVAAVFGVHPMHVEAVAWISVRGDLLCMPLMLGSLLAYLQFVRTGRKSFYVLSIALLPLAMLAKTLAMVFPGLLLLMNVWPLRRIKLPGRWTIHSAAPGDPAVRPVSARAVAMELVPFVSIALGGAALGLATRTAAHTAPSLLRWPLSLRLSNVVFGYSTYVLKLFWPEPMIIEYPLRTVFNPAGVITAFALLMLLSVIAVRSFRRRPYLLIGWAWFLGTMLPTIGFVQTGNYSLADRYTYLPYVGLSVAVVWWASDLWATVAARFAVMRVTVAAAVCGAAISACVFDARRQMQNWSSSYALWTHAYAVAPFDARIIKAAGIEYRLADQFDLALEAYGQGVRVDPTDYDAETKLAGMLLKFGPKEALPHYERAAYLGPKVPYCWWDLGLCQQQMGQFAEAADNYRKALALDPTFQPAIDSLRSVTAEMKRNAARH